MYLIGYIFIIFGGALAITGIALFKTKRTPGSSSIKMFGSEFKLPHTLVVFVMGIFLMVLPIYSDKLLQPPENVVVMTLDKYKEIINTQHENSENLLRLEKENTQLKNKIHNAINDKSPIQNIDLKSVSITWELNSDYTVTGYKIYYGNSSGKYTSVIDVGNVSKYTFKDLKPDKYFFVVSAYNAFAESPVSKEKMLFIVAQLRSTTRY